MVLVSIIVIISALLGLGINRLAAKFFGNEVLGAVSSFFVAAAIYAIIIYVNGVDVFSGGSIVHVTNVSLLTAIDEGGKQVIFLCMLLVDNITGLRITEMWSSENEIIRWSLLPGHEGAVGLLSMVYVVAKLSAWIGAVNLIMLLCNDMFKKIKRIKNMYS